MKKKEIVVGRTYMTKVSGRVVPVRLTSECYYGGWNGVSEVTGCAVRVKSAARLRWEVSGAAEAVAARAAKRAARAAEWAVQQAAWDEEAAALAETAEGGK